jgi:hypothetical protein
MESGGLRRAEILSLCRQPVDNAFVTALGRGILMLFGLGLLGFGAYEYSLATDSVHSDDSVEFAIWIWISGASGLAAAAIGQQRRPWFWLLVVLSCAMAAAVVIWLVVYTLSAASNS